MGFQKPQAVDDTMPPMNVLDMDTPYIPYSQKEPENYIQIVLQQINQCRRELSQHLTEGGTYFIKQRGGTMIPRIVEDQWEVNERCVNQLHDLMLYVIDEEFEIKFKEILEQYNNSKQQLIEKYLKMENDPQKKDILNKTGEFVSFDDKPSIASKFAVSMMRNYKDTRTRRIYQELLLLFKRKNDLSKKRTIGAYD